MNIPCKIHLSMTRLLFVGDLFSRPSPIPEDPESDWEEVDGWEEEENELPPPGETVLTGFGLLSPEEDGSLRISYEDSEITGMSGHLTTFCLAPTGMLILLRRGEQKVCMVFEEGHRHVCDYQFPQDAPTVILHTHEMKAEMTESGGTIRVDYSVEINGTRTEHNLLRLTVTPLS